MQLCVHLAPEIAIKRIGRSDIRRLRETPIGSRALFAMPFQDQRPIVRTTPGALRR